MHGIDTIMLWSWLIEVVFTSSYLNQWKLAIDHCLRKHTLYTLIRDSIDIWGTFISIIRETGIKFRTEQYCSVQGKLKKLPAYQYKEHSVSTDLHRA